MRRIVFCLLKCLLEHFICFPIYLVEHIRYHRHKEANNKSSKIHAAKEDEHESCNE